MPLYSINSLKLMEVIDINTGSKLGYIKDLIIDCVDYKIISIVIPREKSSWLSKSKDLEIPWNRIVKIGVDVLLVNLEEAVLGEK
ncbi:MULTISPECIES: YlmC/YmxH family sporulation protein [Clostridium]|jgi:YlmC/YmxH family sporulation protein|uniref:PRC-barrel domain protein n=2 Tax=Clostridium TaxID=1485 RepID=A0A151AQN4_9CLOT|nr:MULTISPECIES: YlmC/YmxH family sporulation protein [Clostridium]KYH29959.1 PRC-barrel domain protein [Clostridium colicanis DSM 13634]MBE6044166.1 YlmC/YmxH family sporulation protein [Clostridium thermopalmarium]PRR75944.1 PRC-barrel domain protein [Clostridium thermopalmarium DSM 5974]PVZ24521.1 YlmC/YmxH family sporulation protein [Clostridium thermopalmarium DSM 5974]